VWSTAFNHRPTVRILLKGSIMDFTPFGFSLLPFAVALGVFVTVLATLGALMPFFVYQIRNDMRRTAQSLDTMHLNLMRALGDVSRDVASDAAKSARAGFRDTTPPLESFPAEASLAAKAHFHGLSRK
jgi:hypothetical protein